MGMPGPGTKGMESTAPNTMRAKPAMILNALFNPVPPQ